MSAFELTRKQQKALDKAMDRGGNFTNPFEKRSKNRWRRSPLYLLTIVMIAPYYWMITSSFKSVKELQEVPPT